MSSEPAHPEINPDDLLDLLPVGVCIIDRELNVSAWNATLAVWTGISREAALGMNLPKRFPHLAGWCFRDRLAQVFTAGTPTIFSAAFHKYFLPVPPRQGLAASRMIQQTIVRPLGNSRQHAIVVIQDVTAQYIQMEELRSQRLRTDAHDRPSPTGCGPLA
jgi:PAS domain-containing protein